MTITVSNYASYDYLLIMYKETSAIEEKHMLVSTKCFELNGRATCGISMGYYNDGTYGYTRALVNKTGLTENQLYFNSTMMIGASAPGNSYTIATKIYGVNGTINGI